MKTNTNLLILLSFLFLFQLSAPVSAIVGDSINVPRVITPPVIDGAGTDLCWDSAAWNPMPYVWIPYNQTIFASDFTGRFKTVWNEEQNLMYFLFEITDDIFVNGYVFSESNGKYYLYDVVEIFIDENHSGGIHETNNNAYAYHITAGNTSVEYDAIDMWGNTRVNNRSHLPEFKRVQNEDLHTWEFSLMVLNDSYTPSDVPENFKSTLYKDKEMGFSAAYCDDDHSASNPQRDHFIASKYQTLTESNNSYINASIFGFMKLVDQPTSNPATGKTSEDYNTPQVKIFPNPVSDFAKLSFTNSYTGTVDISIFNSTGQLIKNVSGYKSSPEFVQEIDFRTLGPGIFLINTKTGFNSQHQIVII